jgi:deoxycytidylate deaminase
MTETASKSLRRLADDEPYRHDIFIALVAPIGSSRPEVLTAMTERLAVYGYTTDHIHLADLLGKVPNLSGSNLPERTDPEYYKRRMDAGNRLRSHAGDWSALAGIGIMRMAAARGARRPTSNNASPNEPVAYIIDSLKNPREADILRSVYGSAVWVVAIVQDISERKTNLADELARSENRFEGVPEAKAVELIARDQEESEKHGQHVRDVFAIADYFLPVRRGVDWEKGIDRLLEGVFGAPFLSPSQDEDAMRHARAAALRSAAVGRQVGAVIVPPEGAPYILGTNEVPKPGGGQFREGDHPDYRDYRTGVDPNPAYTERVLREVFERLAQAEYFTPPRNEAGGDAVLVEAATKDAEGNSILDGTRARALIEFTRCLHAEQAAIVDAARTGTAINGAKLYTTTFPCHECTKFIIGAGLVEVQYIEPYTKSLAGDMYRDLIDTVPPLESVPDSPLDRVPFRPFLGFGPTRYDEVFLSGERRSGSDLKTHQPGTACPIGRGWIETAVVEREDEVSVAIAAIVDEIRPELDPSLDVESEEQQEDAVTERRAVGAIKMAPDERSG